MKITLRSVKKLMEGRSVKIMENSGHKESVIKAKRRRSSRAASIAVENEHIPLSMSPR